eukprot:CAMPEP_0178411144 /NCGR_PEP_ID=MMETSP0689_2-20121128/21344_1 /TAXON_ID=160604 /ORGANISM="Amphidinium massartii, Strain CS-259" /LENGTH=473 /DNA_ID=CAMNT_0020032343 /DNA_START=72 /DNA_END=1493 /DNA_ORIENTATION=-
MGSFKHLRGGDVMASAQEKDGVQSAIFADIGLKVPSVLLPQIGVDLTKWSVVACDQYTQQPEYWRDVAALVGEEASTLNLIFPEVYLGKEEQNREIIEQIKAKMASYIKNQVLVQHSPGLVLVDRQTPVVPSRKGLVVALDLELYSYAKGSQSLIRPTEKTIPERLPPRIAIREEASVELPHILVLIDDPEETVIEPLFRQRETLRKLYDFDLMQNGGHITGWHVTEEETLEKVAGALRSLADPQRFQDRYEASSEDGVILFPVGDGNHSLATAKKCWENLKAKGADPDAHPARYALVELNNIHDEGMMFEPIHRLVFDVNVEEALADFVAHCESQGWGPVTFHADATLQSMAAKAVKSSHLVEVRSRTKRGVIEIKDPKLVLEVASLTAWLDPYLAAHADASVDYVHGEEIIAEKTEGKESAETTLAFLLPIMDKNDLVKTVVKEGVLPRKTFSMGAADEKRFYLESQQIVL